MSDQAQPKSEFRCVRCGRLIEFCACCGEPDCAPPLCGPCLRDVMAAAMGRVYMHGGASFALEVEEQSSRA